VRETQIGRAFEELDPADLETEGLADGAALVVAEPGVLVGDSVLHTDHLGAKVLESLDALRSLLVFGRSLAELLLGGFDAIGELLLALTEVYEVLLAGAQRLKGGPAAG
jgi:hypothetical protein